jgi:alanine racemase
LEAARLNLIPTVASLEGARQLSAAGLKIKKRLAAHLKIDTGMGRVGVSHKNAFEVVDFLSKSRGAALTGMYTHFSSADSDSGYTRLQIERFNKALKNNGLKNGKILIHASNSAAVLNHPEANYEMVRVGGVLYGLWPGFKPLLSFKARIVFIKKMEKGASVSYGRTFRARKPLRIATVCVGYADGAPRAESNKGEVLVEGRRCKIIGTVTMDMLMIDVTGVPGARVGSEVVLIGEEGKEQISASEAAGFSGTISYETLCAISQRVPRVYVRARNEII